jgi:hypothetical protein
LRTPLALGYYKQIKLSKKEAKRVMEQTKEVKRIEDGVTVTVTIKLPACACFNYSYKIQSESKTNQKTEAKQYSHKNQVNPEQRKLMWAKFKPSAVFEMAGIKEEPSK